MTVAIAHDYLTQRGGAERVVLLMSRAFPHAPVHTSLYAPELTFPEFRGLEIQASPLNRIGVLQRNHRLAFPLLAPVVSRIRINADVVLCSSSGWAHAVEATGRKVVYCYTPARWLYQSKRYLQQFGFGARIAVGALGEPLRRWDKRQALSADRYLTTSSYVAGAIRTIYGIRADVLPPPPAISPRGLAEAADGIEPDFFLCVSRLLSYKNVDAVVRAFDELPYERLVVVGMGPDESRLRAHAGPNVRFLGRVSDAVLRWLYAHTAGVLAASHEDFGLTPLEAASFGKPAAVLRFGGFLDTLVEGTTGVFFDKPEPAAIGAAVEALRAGRWDASLLEQHASRFSEERFVRSLREVVGEAGA